MHKNEVTEEQSFEVGRSGSSWPFRGRMGEGVALACFGVRIVADPSAQEYEAADGVVWGVLHAGLVERHLLVRGALKAETLGRALGVLREQARGR